MCVAKVRAWSGPMRATFCNIIIKYHFFSLSQPTIKLRYVRKRSCCLLLRAAISAMSFSIERSAHRSLLNLERSSAPPAELFDEAARILGVTLDEVKDELFSASQKKTTRRSTVFAAKEEWTLRWLLKKTKPTAKTTSPASEQESSANDDSRKWLLFYYLVQKTPVKRIAKTLRDQDAMQQIQDAVVHLLEAQMASTPASAHPRVRNTISRDSEDVDYALPQAQSRKRKRSPSLEEPVDKDSSTMQVIFAVLRALKVCLEDALATDGEDIVAQQHMRIALSLAPETAATILECVLRILHSILGNATTYPLRDNLLYLVHAASRLWDLRRSPDLGHTVDECNETFTSHCLVPVLSLLELLRDSEVNGQHKDLNAWLERVVVQHAVEPARKVFFNELAIDWKSHHDPMISDHIKPAVDRLKSLLFSSSMVGPHFGDADGSKAALGLVAPVLLELAIRSCPKGTVRKAQHEQPWLEALFVSLAHVGGCSSVDDKEVMQTTNGETDSRQPFTNDIAPPDSSALTSLDRLLSTAIQWKMSLSLPLLSSLAKHFGSLQHQPTNWSVVSKIMQLDINVFLPNSGMTSAQLLLDQLIDALNVESNFRDFPTDSALERHTFTNLVSLLMEGFASARDLGTFVNIWMDRLAEIEAARMSNYNIGKPIKSYSLWEDEDVMANFARVSKTFAIPNFIESHLLATKEAFRDRSTTAKHYALVFVFDILVTTHKEEIESAGEIVKPLCFELRDAVLTFNGFGRTIGLLWRLLRHLIPFVGGHFPFMIFQGIVEGKEQAIIETAIQNSNENSTTYLTSTLHFNEVERFHCFIVIATLYPDTVSAHLDLEISSLTYHLARLGGEAGVKGSSVANLWNGRVTSLENKSDLLTALLGVVLQNSRVLCLDIETTTSLLKVLALHVSCDGEEIARTQSGFAILFEGLLLDEALISTAGFVKRCIKTTGVMDECGNSYRKMAIIQALPKEAMSKAQRRQIAEWQREMVAASKEKELDGALSDSESPNVLTLHEGVFSSKSDSEMTYGDFQLSCQHACRAATLRTREDIISLCESLRKESPSRTNLLLLGSLLNKGDTISPLIIGLAADLSKSLPKSISLENFCLISDCIKIILDKYHDSINQWTIDTLLAQIAIATSSQGPQIPNAAPIIFERLCRLLGVLLGRYRIRLGGRYHLLLPALYGLLHCLFAPESQSLTTPPQVLFHSKLAPWIRLTPNITTTTNKLSKDSATHLTRLLTSICDPTPSAVKRTHNSLTDETKKARNIAGQYMQYFIAEYTYCQLNGRTEVEAKEGLMPGLYAVLDVMGTEVMRGMNAKMDASQRAIWKGLYGDWVRFGRWDGL